MIPGGVFYLLMEAEEQCQVIRKECFWDLGFILFHMLVLRETQKSVGYAQWDDASYPVSMLSRKRTPVIREI